MPSEIAALLAPVEGLTAQQARGFAAALRAEERRLLHPKQIEDLRASVEREEIPRSPTVVSSTGVRLNRAQRRARGLR
jgi:hypothetical protein